MTDTLIHHRVAAARLGQNPTLICHMPSGHLVLCDHQTPRGWCILLPDPVVPDLNALDEPARLAFLSDMAAAGDALLRVTGADRINYSILGNTDPALHAHIQPRYLDEPAHLRRQPIWAIRPHLPNTPFDPTREAPLMSAIRDALSAAGRCVD